MPPKKVTFNANVNVKYIPPQGKGRKVPPRKRGNIPLPSTIPTPPPLPRIAPTPPSTPRPPRSRPLRRYSGMKNLTKIPKQKGGAFTREMAKKLFLKRLTRSPRPTVTRIIKKKESRPSKLKAKKRIDQLKKLRNLAKPSPKQRVSKLEAKKKIKQMLKSSRPTRVIKNRKALEALQLTENKQRKKLINSASPEQINTISEIILNMLQGNINIKGTHKTKLNHHKRSLRALASKGLSVKKRKKILNQHGGMLGAAASALAEYTYNTVQKHSRYPKYVPKNYSSWEYRKKHNDNVGCTIL